MPEMSCFLSAIHNNQLDEQLFNEALTILESGTSGPQTSYWAAKYVYIFYNEDSRFDKKILAVLEGLIETGLSYSKYPDIFIDISKILAQLCFKYNNFKKANNYLLYLKDLSEDLPNWVYNYSAKLLYKLEIESLILDPEPFFKLIDKTFIENTEQGSQSTAIIKEFILNLYDYFSTLGEQKDRYYSLTLKLRELIKPHLLSVEPDWHRFVSLSTDTRFAPDLSDEVTDLKTARINIEFLKYLLDNSNKEVVQLRAKNEAQTESIDYFQKLLKDKDIQYAEQIKQIADIQQTVPVRAELPNVKILVLGANAINVNVIYGIARDHGVAKNQLEIHNDYQENKRYNIENIRYNSPFSGILIGPIAHKITGLGDNPSLTAKLNSEDGYPPFVEVRNKSGSLKITKSSFTEALAKLLTSIKANTPD